MKVSMPESSEVCMEQYLLRLMRPARNKDQSSPKGLTSLASCLLGDEHHPFKRWLASSVNQLLWNDGVSLDYHGGVMFRPPTVACTSPKIILCAESARLSYCLSGNGSDFDSNQDDEADPDEADP